jgi:preprotein translocase subunit SecA
MTNARILDLNKIKETREFESYLRSLSQDQLEYEAMFLIEKIQNDQLGDKELNQSYLLLKELAKRVDNENLKELIEAFADNLKQKQSLKETLQ